MHLLKYIICFIKFLIYRAAVRPIRLCKVNCVIMLIIIIAAIRSFGDPCEWFEIISKRDIFFSQSRIRMLRKSNLQSDREGLGERELRAGNGKCLNSFEFLSIRWRKRAESRIAFCRCGCVVDKNLSHIIAAGHSFRVAARRTIIIAARSRRPCLSGYLNLPSQLHEQ